MGLFAARPEEPFEWAGLPSEPDAEHAGTELLDTPPIDPFAITTGSGGGASISISVDTSTASVDQDAAATQDADPDSEG